MSLYRNVSVGKALAGGTDGGVNDGWSVDVPPDGWSDAPGVVAVGAVGVDAAGVSLGA